MIRSVLGVIILVIVVVLAVINSQAVTLSAIFWQLSISLSIVVFVAFAAGFFLGFLRVIPSLWKTSSAGKSKEKRIKALETEVTQLKQELTDAHTQKNINENSQQNPTSLS